MMGWGGGTQIAGDMIRSIEDYVPQPFARFEIYKDLIAALENADCDNLDNLGECIGISDVFDEALKKHDPRWFDDDEEPADARRCPKCSRRYCNGDPAIFPDCGYPQWEP